MIRWLLRRKCPFVRMLREHFAGDPAVLPIVRKEFGMHDRPNLQLAIEELLNRSGVTYRLVGVSGVQQYMSPTLAQLAIVSIFSQFEPGPVVCNDISIGDRDLPCVGTGLYLVHEDQTEMVVLVTDSAMPHMPKLAVEVMAREQSTAEGFARRLAEGIRTARAFRGKVLSVSGDCMGNVSVAFHQLTPVTLDHLILPQSVLQRLHRHTLAFTFHADVLRRAGRHLKRGILLHGAPGTGKTLIAMYLATQMTGRTVLLIAGADIGSIATACRLARVLEPAMVVLEDVDLIGSERTGQTISANALLFELLNQMDGLPGDADILFVLTSNRPSELEPALASRPGRIDQAIEIPLPDEDCRRRLMELYGQGMTMQLADTDALVRRIDGASGAFIKELLRKAAVLAAEEGAGRIVVQDRHIREAIEDLVVAGGQLTKSLLGVCPQ